MLTSSNTVNTTIVNNNTTKVMDSNGFVNNSTVKKTGIVNM